MRQEMSISEEEDDTEANGSTSSSRHSATLRLVSSSGNDGVSALAVRLLSGSSWRCALAYGGQTNPLFEQVTFASGPTVSQLFPQVAVTGK